MEAITAVIKDNGALDIRLDSINLSDLCLYSFQGYIEFCVGGECLTVNDVPVINMLDKLADALLVSLFSGDKVEIEQPFRSATTNIELTGGMVTISHEEGSLRDQRIILPPIDLIELARSVARATAKVSYLLADRWPTLIELPRSIGISRAIEAYRAAGSPFQIL